LSSLLSRAAAPVPVCLVAKELRSGRLLRLWQDELPGRPPFPVDDRALFVAYMAAAELGCFLELGWPMPARILDLYVEFRALANGRKLPHGRGLLGALAFHGLPGITSEQKEAGRALVMRGGPWTPGERTDVLDYCQADVDCLGPLLERMAPAITARPRGLVQALGRGRYMAAVARMEGAGVPIDTLTLGRLRRHWSPVKSGLVAAIDGDYGVYEGTTFKADRFAAWLRRAGIAWPLTEHGNPCLDQDTFRDMAKLHPQVSPLRELRHTLSDLRLERLAVGGDGRNRAALMPFGARTGRNTPTATGFIFGPSVWLRGLIKPGQNRGLAYIDWSAQEVAIAAALSGDKALIDAVDSGDPYLAFAKRAGLAPPDASRETHPQVRDQCKACVLGSNYGMGAVTLAYRIGVSRSAAEQLLRSLARAFPVFWEWSQHVVDLAMLTGQIRSAFGWPLYVGADARPTALRNYPMQANGAEMLRVACCLATERGVTVCAPVHDALLVEAPASDLPGIAEITRTAMAEAARAVLGGMELRTDVSVVTWPDRYADPRGAVMWQRVNALVNRYTRGPVGTHD
jgi:DNA polymerase I